MPISGLANHHATQWNRLRHRAMRPLNPNRRVSLERFAACLEGLGDCDGGEQWEGHLLGFRLRFDD